MRAGSGSSRCAPSPRSLFFALGTFARPLAARLDESEPPYGVVAARIDRLTAPDERIFVWGNSPQLYVLARRPMGARFSSANFVTGESPGTPTETGARNADLNQDPVRWQMLFEDLERRRPALLVDAAAAGWDGYGKYPLARYPAAARLRRQPLPAGRGRRRRGPLPPTALTAAARRTPTQTGAAGPAAREERTR